MSSSSELAPQTLTETLKYLVPVYGLARAIGELREQAEIEERNSHPEPSQGVYSQDIAIDPTPDSL